MDRVTSTEVLQRLEEQTDGLFRVKDFIPLPCPHPACIQMTYAYVEDDQVTPLPRLLNVGDYLDYITNRAWGELSEDVRQALETMWSAQSVPGTESLASSFSCASCNIQLPESLSELANRIFYVGSHAFMDAHTFDLKRAMKCCVHFLIPDGRMIPFCVYNNVGYREEVLEHTNSS